MSDIMRPIPFDRLVTWMFEEYQTHGSVFGIRKSKFYQSQSDASVTIFGEKLRSLIGPAAGPHSQLAQNIVAAYLTGGRFIELKTVQKMDGEELRKCVARPCINAEDEGYNVEWSTELTVPEAYEEYVKAWFALHILTKELNLPGGFVFNMSVGYDLEGIQSEKIDTYIENLKDASGTSVWKACKEYLADKEYADSISPHICSSVTLSTLHGCPPQEIDRIARYLLSVKGLHTYIKCNPTLLGYENARRILDEMGYDYLSFDNHHFQNDLQFGDAVSMLSGLQTLAKSLELDFGVKITNTFPVKITDNRLPGEEMYMSGRALFPLSINVAAKLSREFAGHLPISYSGGADYFNLEEILKTGIRPVTLATTILKPGGYERMTQLAWLSESCLEHPSENIDVTALDKLAAEVLENPYYLKNARPVGSRKTNSELPLYNCSKAPCENGGCPIEQQIPEYLSLVSQGRYEEAFSLIAVDNASPAVTGTICSHLCQNKCTRLDYEAPLAIRNAKKLAVENAQDHYIQSLQVTALKTDKKAAVIGAGPAGISAAYFLRRNGVSVTVYEKRERPFGMVEYVIPEFRIPREMIQRDFLMSKKMGVDFRLGISETYNLSELKKEYSYIVVATGAWKEGASPVTKGAENVLDALRFLEEAKEKNGCVSLGKKVAVLGGGDVAMDCSRAALRAPGVEEVTVVYRRTKNFMPAESEEIALAEFEGVKFLELLSPVTYDGSLLTCEEMELGDLDATGRRSVKATGCRKVLNFDTVISAIGAGVDTGLFSQNGIVLDERGRAVLNEHNETNLDGVYMAGDCKSGPSNIVKAIADGKIIAKDILHKLGLGDDFIRSGQNGAVADYDVLYEKKGILCKPAEGSADAYRCLRCDRLCEICCDVCPNRANIAVRTGTGHQILHLDGICNECGNCGVFCPYSKETGKPYHDKITLFWTLEDFENSENKGFMRLSRNLYKIRQEDNSVVECAFEEVGMSKEMKVVIEAVINDYPYLLPEQG